MQTPLHDDLVIKPRTAEELYKEAQEKKKKNPLTDHELKQEFQ